MTTPKLVVLSMTYSWINREEEGGTGPAWNHKVRNGRAGIWTWAVWVQGCALTTSLGCLSKVQSWPLVSTEEDHVHNGLVRITRVRQSLLHLELEDNSGFTDDAKISTLDSLLCGFKMGYCNQRWGDLERRTKNKCIVISFICYLCSVMTYNQKFVLLCQR